MTQAQQPTEPHQAPRVFEQPPDAISLYSDLAQVLSTGNEIVLQFYESIPGPPGPDGQFTVVRTRLRATIMLSFRHAANIGDILRTRVQESTADQPGAPQ